MAKGKELLPTEMCMKDTGKMTKNMAQGNKPTKRGLCSQETG